MVDTKRAADLSRRTQKAAAGWGKKGEKPSTAARLTGREKMAGGRTVHEQAAYLKSEQGKRASAVQVETVRARGTIGGISQAEGARIGEMQYRRGRLADAARAKQAAAAKATAKPRKPLNQRRKYRRIGGKGDT